MKRYLVIAVSTALLLLACSESEKNAESGIEKEARSIIEQFSQEQFEPIIARFDSTMKANVSAEQLASIRSSLIAQCGEYEKQAAMVQFEEPPFKIVYVEMVFSKLPYWAKIIFDDSSRIVGLRFSPNVPQDNEAIADYINPDLFLERGGEFGDNDWKLPAVVAIPKGEGPFPAVILVPRHGAYDKDEKIGANSPFKDIAGGLASMGIAVLRYDNRSLVYQNRLDTLSTLTVQVEIIRDIHYAVALLKQSAGIDSNRVFVLGHGFGGTLLPRVAEQTNYIAGYIAMGSPTRPLQQVIHDEIEFIYAEDGHIAPSEREALEKLAAEAGMADNPELTKNVPGEYLPLGRPGSYWLDLRQYDPIKIGLEMDEPFLILHGERDYHATMQDFESWRQLLLVRDNVHTRSFPYLNHLFMRGEGRASPMEYMIPGHVDGEVIRYIADWIKSQD